MTPNVCAFVEALVEWADASWSTTTDTPFITVGCTDRSVIFKLWFRMDLPDGDPVLITDPVVGRILREGGGVERATAPQQDVVH